MGNIIDIWAGNNVTDWNKVAQSTDLVIIRSQYGSLKEDSKWRSHVAGCKSVGLPFGMYAYGCYVSVEDAKLEARDFLKRIDSEAKFLVLDTEADTIKSMSDAGKLGDLAKASQAFIDVLKEEGYKVGFYVSHNLYKQYGLDTVRADFLWIPRYGTNDGTPQAKPAYACDLWQYTDVGQVSGIQGNVDLNKLNGDKSFEWFIGSSNSLLPQEEVLGYLTTTADIANIRKEPRSDAPIMRTAVKGEGHTYYAWSYDGAHFWYKVATDNWMRDDVVSINKDGKTTGVVWVSATDVNLRKGASTGDPVINKITKQAAYDVHYRYEDWIYVTGEGVEGWMYFDESYVKWIR